MIGYVTIGVRDMEKAKIFYSSLFADIGASVLIDMGRIAFIGKSMKSPLLAMKLRFRLPLQAERL